MAFIEIAHPKLKLTATVAESALIALEGTGWKRAEAPAPPPPPAKSAGVEEWREYAATRGVEYDIAASATKAELVDRFHPDGPPAGPKS